MEHRPLSAGGERSMQSVPSSAVQVVSTCERMCSVVVYKRICVGVWLCMPRGAEGRWGRKEGNEGEA